MGQHIFDAFPDNPQAPEANAVANVRTSLTQVLATKQPHEMAPQQAFLYRAYASNLSSRCLVIFAGAG
ncbi:MAG: hypothetical protein EOO62_23195 [Hymenobacter sp.]|nr:MAG: hypothetical protein EOO62_23195 [Hymenobacter sp.]